MQTTKNPNPVVSLRVTRVIWWQGQWRQPGDEIEADYVTARGLESTYKATITDKPQGDEVVVSETSAETKKGKAK